jgi:transposase-like protein
MNAVGKNVPIGGPATAKTTVFGIVQRGAGKGKSRARAMVVPNHRGATLIPKIYENVVPGSTLYTDALRSYRQTDRDFIHEFIDHSIEYANGRVHTNTIETFGRASSARCTGRISRCVRSTSTHTWTSRCSGSMHARARTRIGSWPRSRARTASVSPTPPLRRRIPGWRLRPGRVAKALARAAARRAAMEAAPISGKSDRI